MLIRVSVSHIINTCEYTYLVVLILGAPIKFVDNPDLPDEQCYSLLKDYMPAHVTRNKVLQQLFIKYRLGVVIHNVY